MYSWIYTRYTSCTPYCFVLHLLSFHYFFFFGGGGNGGSLLCTKENKLYEEYPSINLNLFKNNNNFHYQTLYRSGRVRFLLLHLCLMILVYKLFPSTYCSLSVFPSGSVTLWIRDLQQWKPDDWGWFKVQLVKFFELLTELWEYNSSLRGPPSATVVVQPLQIAGHVPVQPGAQLVLLPRASSEVVRLTPQRPGAQLWRFNVLLKIVIQLIIAVLMLQRDFF